MGKAPRQFASFALVGVAGLVVDIVVLYACLSIGLGYYGGRVCSFLAAVWATWELNRRYTFAGGATNAPRPQWWRYLLAMLGGGVVNYLAYSAVVSLAPGLPFLPVVAVAAGSLAGMFVNFSSAKFLVFKK
ncbi:GtrA family protein [Massilia suwonensis]|uniref:GtrA family protein n=1 Tax=Massilia suwonensis TaxID=648895 RepID=A0ABW0MPA0_9BURK